MRRRLQSTLGERGGLVGKFVMKREYDVVIIGAGGAGLNIAWFLGRYNLSICLIDTKRDLLNLSFHTLGSFLDLEKFDLSEKVIAARISEVVVSSKHFHIRKHGEVNILHKRQLHKELLDKCRRKNIDILTSTHIVSFERNKDGSLGRVVDEKGNKYKGKIFIDCSGVSGVLSRQLGLQDKLIDIAVGLEYNAMYFGPSNQAHLMFGDLYKGGYGWIFPLGNKRAIFGFGSFDSIARGELKQRLDAISKIPYFKKLIFLDKMTLYGGTIPVTQIRGNLVRRNVVCIGDSISQVNPLVGEGYRFVLEAGFIAAPYIYKAVKQEDLSLLSGYENEWRKKFFKDYVKAKKVQEFAHMVSKSDIASDIVNLFVAMKREISFVDFISGSFERNLLLP